MRISMAEHITLAIVIQKSFFALVEGTNYFDIGNHHFPSTARAQLAEKLATCTPEGLTYSIFSSGGSEAIDVALKCARYATKRKNDFH